jgi:hypothetical protein
MSAGEESYEARPFLKIRRAYIDNFEAARRKNFIHGLVEMDVTEIRRSLRHLEAGGGTSPYRRGHACCRPCGG